MNHLADFVLMYQANIEKAIADKRDDMCLQKTGGGSSNHAFISDPTCQKALRNIMPVGTVMVQYGPKIAGKCDVKTLRNPEKWLYVVENTWNYFIGRPAMGVMILRYKRGCINMYQVARELNLSSQRCYVLLDDVHRYVLDNAKGCGAYEVKTKHVDRLEELMLNVIKKESELKRGIENKAEKENVFTN